MKCILVNYKMKKKLLLLLEHGFHAQVLLFYRWSTHLVLLGFVLGLRAIVIYWRPYGHIVSCKEKFVLSLKCWNTSKIKSAYMKSHVHLWKKPIYKRNSSSIWIIHSLISHMKKEAIEGRRKKYEEEVEVFGSLYFLLGNAKLGFMH